MTRSLCRPARSDRKRGPRFRGRWIMTTLVRVSVCVLVGLPSGCGAPESTSTPGEDTESGAPPGSGAGTILRADPRLDALVPPDAHIEKLAEGFIRTEGVRSGSRCNMNLTRRSHGATTWPAADAG